MKKPKNLVNVFYERPLTKFPFILLENCIGNLIIYFYIFYGPSQGVYCGFKRSYLVNTVAMSGFPYKL